MSMIFQHGVGSPRLPVLACASRTVTPASSGGDPREFRGLRRYFGKISFRWLASPAGEN